MKKILFLFLLAFNVSATDLIIFSYDRPMQLAALLASLFQNTKNLGKVSVIYRYSGMPFQMGFNKLIKEFPNVTFKLQQSKEEFRSMTLELVESSSQFVCFAVDDLIVRGTFDFKQCEQILESTGAYGFYLRLGRNINFSYMANKESQISNLQSVDKDIFSFNFKNGTEDWAYPNSLDMVIYRRNDVVADLMKLNFNTPNFLEGSWAGRAKLNQEGLIFSDSKVVNIPINMVNRSTNRNMNSYSTRQLLKMFNQGFKLDIEYLSTLPVNSPHMELKLKFKKR